MPRTSSQGRSGSVHSSSIVPSPYSPANSRIEITGLSTTSSIPMFWKVSSIDATPVRKML